MLAGPIKVSSTGPVFYRIFTLFRLFYLNIIVVWLNLLALLAPNVCENQFPIILMILTSICYLMTTKVHLVVRAQLVLKQMKQIGVPIAQMDMSDSNDPSLLTAKDGTKWKEFLPVDIPRPGFSPKIVNHIPKVTARCDNCETLIGSVTFLYSLVFLFHLDIFSIY